MRRCKLILPPPWMIRLGFWLCLSLYVLAFFLPADAEHPQQKGYSLFLAGIWGLIVAVYGAASVAALRPRELRPRPALMILKR